MYLPIAPRIPDETTYSVKCTHCGRIVCTMQPNELLPFLQWLTETNEIVLCFNCEEDWYARLWARRRLCPGSVPRLSS